VLVTESTDEQSMSTGPPCEVIRTCIGCRQRSVATDLLRVVVVAADQGESLLITADPRRRAPGRGAWLHPDRKCVELAERRRAFGRALRLQSPADPTPVREYVESVSTK
jgi:predicted RNA-binding protein YlxR (DUF448 family)